MALQPTRPIGSTQVLTFSGAITTGVPFAQFSPTKPNATIASDFVPAPGTFTGIRFLLGDVSVPATPTQTLPGFVFDDSQLAGVSPHAAVPTALTAITQANEQDITARTWCENTYITIEPGTAAAAALLTGVNLSGAQFVIDTLTSGLGTNTGLPVLILPCELSALPQLNDLVVTVIIEVRHTASR